MQINLENISLAGEKGETGQSTSDLQLFFLRVILHSLLLFFIHSLKMPFHWRISKEELSHQHQTVNWCVCSKGSKTVISQFRIPVSVHSEETLFLLLLFCFIVRGVQLLWPTGGFFPPVTYVPTLSFVWIIRCSFDRCTVSFQRVK